MAGLRERAHPGRPPSYAVRFMIKEGWKSTTKFVIFPKRRRRAGRRG
jgi:hypothetical protein